ncbi:DUF559 domain-containing protein [Trujillonella endophytica]|uniref:DUF559 domain-containing protein n=1 Tax=Trujillonella endophytica TaxID=673521 RepID=UPI0014817651|nr:DUF559 domain-containing protein [Trujillella endophytica]
MPTPPVPARIRRPSTRRSARDAGVSDWQLRHRDVVRTSRDTYLPRDATGDVRGRAAAVLLGAPSGAVLSHWTAADLWELEIPLQRPDPRIHLTAPPPTRVRHRADRRIHVSAVPPAQVFGISGLPVTSPGRTWLDLAACLEPAALLAVTDQMLRRRYPRSWLLRLLGEADGRRGVRTARAVLPLADPLAGSPMESVLRWLLHEADLPSPVLQQVVRDGSGFLGRVDMAWPDQRVLVEFDGEVHREREVFVRDLRRQNGLVLAGWTILRFSSADVVGRPGEVVAAIRTALGL